MTSNAVPSTKYQTSIDENGLVDWVCPYCGSDNQDDYLETALMGCGECGEDVDWDQILTGPQFDALNALLWIRLDFVPGTTVKGLINYRHSVKQRADGTHRGLFRRLLRAVEVEGKLRGPTTPPTFSGWNTPEWARDRPWILWQGYAQVNGERRSVQGWAWEGHLPRIWGLDDWQERHGDISAWLWLVAEDYPHRKANPYGTPAWRYVRKYGLEDEVQVVE